MAGTSKARQRIVEALSCLLAEKSFDSISVSEIIERSGVSRKTFYNYFPDKYSLVNWVFYQKCLEIKEVVLNEDPWGYILSVAELMGKERETYASLIQNMGQNELGQYFSDLFYELFQNSLADGFKRNSISDDGVAMALTGLVELTRMSFALWLSNPEARSAEEFVSGFRRIASTFAAMVCYGNLAESEGGLCDHCRRSLGTEWDSTPDKSGIRPVPPEREGLVRDNIRTAEGRYRKMNRR